MRGVQTPKHYLTKTPVQFKCIYDNQIRYYTQQTRNDKTAVEQNVSNEPDTFSTDKWFKAEHATVKYFKRYIKNKQSNLIGETNIKKYNLKTPEVAEIEKSVAFSYFKPLLHTVARSKLIIQQMKNLTKFNTANSILEEHMRKKPQREENSHPNASKTVYETDEQMSDKKADNKFQIKHNEIIDNLRNSSRKKTSSYKLQPINPKITETYSNVNEKRNNSKQTKNPEFYLTTTRSKFSPQVWSKRNSTTGKSLYNEILDRQKSSKEDTQPEIPKTVTVDDCSTSYRPRMKIDKKSFVNALKRSSSTKEKMSLNVNSIDAYAIGQSNNEGLEFIPRNMSYSSFSPSESSIVKRNELYIQNEINEIILKNKDNLNKNVILEKELDHSKVDAVKWRPTDKFRPSNSNNLSPYRKNKSGPTPYYKKYTNIVQSTDSNHETLPSHDSVQYYDYFILRSKSSNSYNDNTTGFSQAENSNSTYPDNVPQISKESSPKGKIFSINLNPKEPVASYKQFVHETKSKGAKRVAASTDILNSAEEVRSKNDKSFISYFVRGYQDTESLKSKNYSNESMRQHEQIQKTADYNRTLPSKPLNTLEPSDHIVNLSESNEYTTNVLNHFLNKQNESLGTSQKSKYKVTNTSSHGTCSEESMAPEQQQGNTPVTWHKDNEWQGFRNTRPTEGQSNVYSTRSDPGYPTDERYFTKNDESSYSINTNVIDFNLPLTPTHWYDQLSDSANAKGFPQYRPVFTKHDQIFNDFH